MLKSPRREVVISRREVVISRREEVFSRREEVFSRREEVFPRGLYWFTLPLSFVGRSGIVHQRIYGLYQPRYGLSAPEGDEKAVFLKGK